MILYVMPKDGRGMMMTCHSHAEVRDAMQTLHALEGTTEFSVVRGDVVCDFCSTPGVVSMYRADPGHEMHAEITGESEIHHMDADGLWAACPDCDAILTDALNGDPMAMHKLAKRSTELFMDSDPGCPESIVWLSVTQAHAFFFTYWNREPGERILTDSEIMEGE